MKIENAELNSTIQLQDSLLKSYGKQLERWEELNKANQSIIEGFKLRETKILKDNKRHTWVVGSVCFSIGFTTGVLLMLFKEN